MSGRDDWGRRCWPEQVAAWLVTGPVGHLVGFFAEAVSLWGRAGLRAARRVARDALDSPGGTG